MDPALIDDDSLPLARKSVLPGTGFFYPADVEIDPLADSIAAVLEPGGTDAAGVDAVAIADPDADGLACVALLRAVADGEVGLVPAGPHELEAALAELADRITPGTTVYLCDLCPDSFAEIADPLDHVVDRADRVEWFDHHQWEEEVANQVRDLGVRLEIGDSDEECSADVTARSLDADLPAYLTELVAVTRDHDLWIRADERSDDLADYAHWSEPAEYIETVLEHGPDLPAEVHTRLTERRVEKEALIDLAVKRAELREIGPWTVGITYGRCSQNEVAEALRVRGADAAIIVKPAGSASIRGSEGFERCHEVAGQVNGGGHPRAAGCKPDIYDDMLDYAHHWTTNGAVAKRVIRRAFERIAADTPTPENQDPSSDASAGSESTTQRSE